MVFEILVTKKLESENITMEQYTEKYNQKSTGYSNSLVILHIPIFAFLLSLIYFRKKYFYVDHMIYAIYFLAFLLLAGLLRVGIVYILMLMFAEHGEIIWSISGAIFLISIFTYVYFSVKPTYHQKTWRAVPAMVPVFAAFVISHMIYRTLLFLIIFSVT